MPQKSRVESFRDLIAWKKGVEIVKETYEATRMLPDGERFGLTSQMRRCAISIPANISEGWGRSSTKDYVRFLRVARGSCFELLTFLEICRELGYPGPWLPLIRNVEEVSRVIGGLISALRRRACLSPSAVTSSPPSNTSDPDS